jgi:hypothetical protein
VFTYSKNVGTDQFTTSHDEEYFLRDLIETVSDRDSDEEVAGLVADLFLCRQSRYARRGSPCHLYVFHDTRIVAHGGAGPGFGERCPLPFTWRHKNVVGVSMLDRAFARQWCVRAMLAGYVVMFATAKGGGGCTPGTIAEIRKLAHKRAKGWDL